MRDRYTVLATAYLTRPQLGRTPARTLLVGAAVLHVEERFSAPAVHLDAHSTLVTDNPADTLAWLAGELWEGDRTLLLWRAEDIVVPSLIAAAEDSPDAAIAAQFLRRLERSLTGRVIDVAELFGGAKATSLDAILHKEGLPFRPMTRNALDEAYRTSCHGDVLDHLKLRALGLWRLWARRQSNAEALEQAVDAAAVGAGDSRPVSDGDAETRP
jgi:hypothetical protein